MAKIYPRGASLASSVPGYVTCGREVFTIWMKSLVLNGCGCTVFDSNGDIVYRIDNYNHKCRGEVFLMDHIGTVLITIHKRKFKCYGCWEGYKSTGTKPDHEKEKLWFQVQKTCCKILKGNSSLYCEVTVKCDKNDDDVQYRIEKSNSNKYGCKILDKAAGRIIAEVKQKQTDSGVPLGDDVLTLVVEPDTDHSLVIGLVVVYALINNKL